MTFITKTHLFNFTDNFTCKKLKIFRLKTLIFFIFLLKTRRCGSNEYPQSMILSRNKKNNVYSCKPQFYYIKVGFNGVRIIQACFRDFFPWIPSHLYYYCIMTRIWLHVKIYTNKCLHRQVKATNQFGPPIVVHISVLSQQNWHAVLTLWIIWK